MIDKKIYKWEMGSYFDITKTTVDGIPTHEIIDGTLDAGTIVVYNDQENAFKLWQSVKIVVNSSNQNKDPLIFHFVIADIQTELIRKFEPYLYKHILSLIEPTKYLEKIVCSSISFTNKTHTLRQQLERALLNAEVVEYGSLPRFKLSQRLINFLGYTPGEDFFFEKPLLKEVLDEMLSVVNARCEVKEITDFNNIEIDYYLLNERKNLINPSRYINKIKIQNIEYLASDLEAYAMNSFSENKEIVFHPSPNGWRTWQTEEETLSTENAIIETAFPIESITKFIIKGVFFGISASSTSGLYSIAKTVDLDIAGNVLDIETWNLLKNYDGPKQSSWANDEFYKENTIHYERGTSSMDRLDWHSKYIYFKVNNLELAVKNYLFKNGISYLQQEYPGVQFSGVTNLDLYDFKILEALFRIEYIPYIDAHINVSKQNYSNVKSTMIDNQSEKIVDLGRYGKNLQSSINRLGNEEPNFDTIVRDISEIYNIGDYTSDGYIIVGRDLAFHNHYIKVHYDFSKEFPKVNQRIGINREKRVYNIPLESFERNILIKNYINVDFNAIRDESSLIVEFMKTFMCNADRYPITSALVKTDVVDSWYELPIIPFVVSNTLNYLFKFDNNRSAGLSIGNQILGGKKITINSYTNDSGEYNDILIRLFDAYEISPIETYDSVKNKPKVNISLYGNVNFLVNKIYSITKDAYEHHSFTYQIEIISDNPDIIIGPAFAKLNALITDKKVNLHVFDYEGKYNYSDSKRKGLIATNEQIILEDNKLTVSFTEYGTINSWCIATIDGDLVLAVNRKANGNLPKELYFTFSKNRKLT